jgi:L-arabinokinase
MSTRRRGAPPFYGDFDRRVDEEAAFLDAARATVVIGDIPPLAFAAAARARVPSVAVGNFTWDWIYSGYEAFRSGAGGVRGAGGPRSRRCHRHDTGRLLDSHPRAATSAPWWIRFHGRRHHRHPVYCPAIAAGPCGTRARLGIASDRPFVLASFSAADLDLPYDAIAEAEHLTILAPEREPPASLTYPDLVAAADVVVSKPGYGIVSECVANGTALLYTSRGRFIEHDVFVAEMPRCCAAAILRARTSCPAGGAPQSARCGADAAS